MTGRYLVDTNILVYAYDRSEPEKQETAIDIIDSLAKVGSGVLSPQILSEFFNVVTRKIPAREFPQFLKSVPFFFRRNRPLGLLERQEKALLNNRAKALFLR
jgi:predicted nucleic acid-binding protein